MDFPEKTAEAARAIIKMVVLANAGGVAATVATLGATYKNGCFEGELAWPLSFFSAGVVFCIGYSMSLYLRIAKYEEFEPSPAKWLVSTFFTRWSGHAAVVLFILGCISGVFFVAVS